MSFKASPFQKLIATRSRLLLCLLGVGITWLLSIHYFTSGESFIPAQRISHPGTVTEGDKQQSHSSSSDIAPSHTSDSAAVSTPSAPCQSLQGLDDIFLVVRTGASEALEKLPIHLETTLRCLPNESYGIWSDLEETINGYHVADALDEVSPSIVSQHADFKYYQRLKEGGRAAFSAEEQAAWASAPNTSGGRNTPGWKLDKWKFLPLAKKAYEQRPDAKWFIFTECDGHINWRSLLYWLKHHDPSTPYVGMLMIIGDVVFAYGGSSFVVSNEAMKAAVEHYTSEVDTYEDFTSHHWAGDCVLGKALKDVNVDFTQAWPTFHGESPFETDYNNSVTGPDPKVWCYNAMTWHHVSPSDIRELSDFEDKWNLENSSLLRHADVFRHLVMPKFRTQLDDWDNLSSDKDSADTLEDCRAACQGKARCLQFSFRVETRECKTSSVVKLGRRQEWKSDAANQEHISSGWIMDRIEAFAAEMDTYCHKDGWVVT